MKKDSKISSMQFVTLLAMTLGPVTGTYSPSIMAQIAGQDMWISVLISVALITMSSVYLYWLSNCFPNQTLIQFSTSILGRVLGKVVAFLYIIYFFFMTILYISIFSTTFKTLFFKDTPLLFFIIMLTIGCLYSAFQGIESLARISTLWAFIFYIVELVGLVVIVIPISDFGNYLPIREAPWSKIMYASLFAFNPQSQIILITMMYPFIHKRKGTGRIILIGIFSLSTITVLLSIIEVALFSAKQLSLFLYPPVELISMIRLGEFFERTEIFFVVGWGIIMLLGTFSLFTVFLTALGQWLQRPKGYQGFQIPGALLVIGGSLFLFPNTTQLLNYLFGYGIYISLGFQLVIPILMGIVLLLKRGLLRGEAKGQC